MLWSVVTDRICDDSLGLGAFICVELPRTVGQQHVIAELVDAGIVAGMSAAWDEDVAVELTAGAPHWHLHLPFHFLMTRDRLGLVVSSLYISARSAASTRLCSVLNQNLSILVLQ